ncbi:hypothetical protein ES704_01378 [subsurface metagenome]|jgi:hypothetical protein
MRRPNKPHRDRYEDEEDCEGYYDPDEAERRGCHHGILMSQRNPKDPCRVCHEAWKSKEDARRKAEWDAKTPEEKAAHEKLIKGLRELY